MKITESYPDSGAAIMAFAMRPESFMPVQQHHIQSHANVNEPAHGIRSCPEQEGFTGLRN